MAAYTTAHRVLASCGAYLRLNMATGAADAVNGAQVDFLLTDVYQDQDVRPGRGGRYQVVVGGRTVRYAPIAGGCVEYAELYEHSTCPDGRTSHAHGSVSGVKVRKAVVNADNVHTLTDGTIVRLARGRCMETWTPSPVTTAGAH